MTPRTRRAFAAATLLAAATVSWAVGAPAASAADDGNGQCTASTREAATPPALNALQADLAWSVNTKRGAGVVVAVVDSGIDAANPHLGDAISGGRDLVDDGHGLGGYADTDGHGTALAGIIAARTIPGSGVEGLAPGATLMSVRVFAGTDQDTVQAGHGPSTALLAEGIEYAADNGANIVNVSMSTSQNDPLLAHAVAYAQHRGVLIVAAAGNRTDSTDADAGTDPDSMGSSDADGPRYPAAYPGVIGVAAADMSGTVTSSSIHGPQVDLSAPGQNILTTSSAGGDCIYSPDSPATSFATAYVSAAAALVASQYPTESPAEWAYRLEATAVRADPDARDDVSGWGFVQPYDALTLVPGPGVRGPKSPFPGGGTAAGGTSRAATVHVVARPSALAEAEQIALFTGLGAVVVLGVIGALLVLRDRRDAAPWEEPSDTADRPGLFGSPPDPDADQGDG